MKAWRRLARENLDPILQFEVPKFEALAVLLAVLLAVPSSAAECSFRSQREYLWAADARREEKLFCGQKAWERCIRFVDLFA